MNFLNPYAKIHNMTSLSRVSLYQLNMAKMRTKLQGQIICLDLQSRKGDLQILKLSAIKMVAQLMDSEWYWMVEDRDNSRIADNTGTNNHLE